MSWGRAPTFSQSPELVKPHTRGEITDLQVTAANPKNNPSKYVC